MARSVVRFLASLALVVQLCAALAASASADGPPARYIVVASDDATTAAFAPVRRSRALELAAQVGARPESVYDTVLDGFAAHLTPRQVERLLATGAVAVVPDLETHLAAQTVPTGVQRIGTLANPTAKVDGIDDPLPVDVAVLDTGIDPTHPDLNVVGGYDCTGSGSWVDRHGHGTHVAGIIGARDNGQGVVGVAPGARLWAIKVFGDNGSGYVSWLICGLNWVAANAGTIAVANYSGGASGSDTPNCGGSTDPLHRAVCNVVQAGVTLVVAAGNGSQDASTTVPAAYPEAIAVGAIVDTDGQPGGLGPSTSYGADDTRASFSNYGPAVDFYAPGYAILSTVPGGGYQRWSGTSMAAPHVAGAAALYRAQNPGASPSQVRSFLASVGEAGAWDSYGQRLVRVDWAGSTPPPGQGGNQPATHDVAVSGLTVPNSVTVGTSVTVAVVVRNEGSVTEAVTVSLSANGAAVGSPQTVSLDAGASRTLNFSWQPASPGTYTVEARATISEDSDPSDNQRSATVNVVQQTTATRDVAITDLVVPASVTRGQSATVSVTLENRGTSSVTVTVSLSTSPRNAAMGTVSSRVTLAPGQVRTLSFTWRTNSRTALATYTLTASAPLSGDANPADNTRTATITVTAATRR